MARLGRGRPNQWRRLQAAPVDYLSPTPADVASGTDTADYTVDFVQSQADSVGLTDAVVSDLARPLTTSAVDSAIGSDVASIGFGPGVADTATGSDAVSYVINLGQFPADTAPVTDTPTVVQTQFQTYSDSAGGSDNVGIGFGPPTFAEFVTTVAEVQVQWDQVSSTSSLVSTGTPTTTGTTWASTTNAVGAADTTLATFTSTASGTIQLAGYNAQVAVGAQPTSLKQIDVTVTYKVATAARWLAPSVQLYSGTTAIGSAITLPAATTTLASQTVSFLSANLPTWAQLADLQVRVLANKSGATSDTFSLDAATAVVQYINTSNPSQFINYNPAITTDPAGLTDTIDQLRTVFNTNADSVSGTDVPTTAAGYSRSAADSAGVTDAVTPIRGLPPVLPADTATGSDAATTVTGVQRTLADTAAGSDIGTVIQDNKRTAADSAALSDAVTAKKETLAKDNAQLSDAVTVVQKIVRTPADSVAATDVGKPGGTATYILGSTAIVESHSSIGVREVHKLRANVTVDFNTTTNLVRGPRARATVDVTITGNLTHPRAMDAEIAPLFDFPSATVRIVRSMRDTIRMPPPDQLPMSSRRMTNVPEPEPAEDIIEDPDWLPEEPVETSPTRYKRTFAVLRS